MQFKPIVCIVYTPAQAVTHHTSRNIAFASMSTACRLQHECKCRHSHEADNAACKGAYRGGLSLAVFGNHIQLIRAILSITAKQDCILSRVVGQ